MQRRDEVRAWIGDSHEVVKAKVVFSDSWDDEPTQLEATVTMAELIEGGPSAPRPRPRPAR